jgi:hypothetical protein
MDRHCSIPIHSKFIIICTFLNNIQVLVTFRITAVPADHAATFVLYWIAALRTVLQLAVGALESAVGRFSILSSGGLTLSCTKGTVAYAASSLLNLYCELIHSLYILVLHIELHILFKSSAYCIGAG